MRSRNSCNFYNSQDRDSAEAIIRELQAHGAIFAMEHTDARGWFYCYTVVPGGNVDRCRRIVAEARKRPIYPLIRVEVFVQIMRKRMALAS